MRVVVLPSALVGRLDALLDDLSTAPVSDTQRQEIVRVRAALRLQRGQGSATVEEER